MSIAVLATVLLEATGTSAIAFPFMKEPVPPLLRVAKPLCLALSAYAMSLVLGSSLATLVVFAHAFFGMLKHREYCADHGVTWLASRSPFLFRNDNQIKLWSSIADRLAEADKKRG